MEGINIQHIKDIQQKLESKILSMRNKQGVWDGKLSSSALSTAVAVFALWIYDKDKNAKYIEGGLQWLNENQNSDGGFGDTIKSGSNLSTTLLCWSAFSIARHNKAYSDCISQLENWLRLKAGSLEPETISKAVLNHYKTDKTFSVPILAMCALAGRLGERGWKYVPQLPYQFAAFPDRFFRFLNLSVVSYAIPALISMGLVRQKKRPTKNPAMKLINRMVQKRVLHVLASKQPENGGFLEASPLTGFVLMTLTGAGMKGLDVCKKAESFLQESIRNDGSWPIDTSLTTWVTSLAINSLSKGTFEEINPEEKEKMLRWLLNQQHKTIHPFTKSQPGGWAWIDKQGGVPDGDDTSGALIAIKRLAGNPHEYSKQAILGIKWLMGIQNNDGGFPTFCRGWGSLPFDASCPDITAHAIRAFAEWKDMLPGDFRKKIGHATSKALRYLEKNQRKDGSWLPLWFGNENDKNHLNPVYGTSQVLIALAKIKNTLNQNLNHMAEAGLEFLQSAQNADGGWGGNKGVQSSIEETSLAIRACVANSYNKPLPKALEWLKNNLKDAEHDLLPATPIGLYFASLWYFEEMYPYTYSAAALKEISKLF